MKRTLNRILALGMAICMLLSLVVVQASAATTTDGLQSQISAAAGSSVQIVLDGDVTLDQTIQIPAKTAVTITTDGAARTVKRGEGLTAAMFNVPAGSTLTLSGGESRLMLDGRVRQGFGRDGHERGHAGADERGREERRELQDRRARSI